MKQIIQFDKSATKKILSYFNKTVNSEGYVIEKETKEKVLSFDGTEVQLEDFGGIMLGSEIYIKSDLDSIIKFLEKDPDA